MNKNLLPICESKNCNNHAVIKYLSKVFCAVCELRRLGGI